MRFHKFPKEARYRVGRVLFRLQVGDHVGMPASRQMPSVAAGVAEVRVNTGDGAFRVFYYIASRTGVIVFHAFSKKTQQRHRWN